MSHISKSDCVEILKSKLGNTDFQLEDFNVKYFDDLMGFHANHASLLIQAIVDGAVTEYKFFVKTGTENPVINEKYWKVQRQFYKEHVFLTQLAKNLQNFVNQKITAECYLSKLDRFVVLEDLCGLGYQTSKKPVLDMVHADRAVQAFANLHASSILYEEKTGICITEKHKDINYESLFSEMEKYPKQFLLYSVDQGVRAIGEKFLTHLNPEEQDRIFAKIRRRTTETQIHPKKFRKVVCQGDPWGNNILYRYSNDDKPTEGILVDFGCQRFAPPAMDLMQFLYLGTSSDFRIRYRNQIKEIYYKHLGTILSENGVDVNQVMPRSLFMESCDFYEEFGMCCRVYYEYVTRLPGPYLLKAASSAESFLGLMATGNPELGLEAFENDESYRKGVTEAIEDAFHFYK